MDNVPNEILQRAYQRRAWHVLKAPFLWCIVVALGAVGVWASHHLARSAAIAVGCLCGVLIGTMVRGIGSVGHDAAHGLAAKNKVANYLLGFTSWSATLMSYTLYRTYHLDHHRIVGRPNDVDRVQVGRFTSSPELARWLRTAIYLGLYPIYWATQMGRYSARLSVAMKLRMYFEFAFMYGGLLWLYYVMGPVAFFSVVGAQTVVGAMLASLTSMIEHYDIPYHPDAAYTSRTYATANPFLSWLWSGTPYHAEHHRFPGIPHYNLRAFHLAARGYYSDPVAAHVYPDFASLAWRLVRRAATADLDEEREIARRDEAALAGDGAAVAAT